MREAVIRGGSLFRRVLFRSQSDFARVSNTSFSLREDPDVVIKNDGDESLDVFGRWARDEKWNPGLDDMSAYFSQDPGAMNTLWCGGKPVSMLQSMKYSNGFGYLGLYRVDPTFRGGGFGVRLWDFSMDRLSSCQGISLNAVLEQVENYSTYGFDLKGIVSRWSMDSSMFVHPSTLINSSYVLVSNNDINVSEITEMDARLSGYPRRRLWERYCYSSNTQVLGLRLKGGLIAYAVLLRCVNGYKFSSVFAPEANLAHYLMSEVCKRFLGDGDMLQLDTSDENVLSSKLAISCGFGRVFGLRRMTKGESPEGFPSAVFGLSTVENG